MRLLPLLALLSLSSALAQIAQPVSGLSAQLPGFKLSGNVLSSGAASLTLEQKGNLLKSARVRLPSSDTAQAGKLFALLTGTDGLAQPFQNFLEQNAKALSSMTSSKPANVNAEGYAVSLYQDGSNLVFTVKLAETPESTFRPVTLLKGDPKAPIAIRVFSDFQCPYCEKLEKEFLLAYARTLPKDVRLEFHHMPLEQIHPNARPSAEASECASEQKGFWAFHDLLFADRSWVRLKDPSSAFSSLAGQAKLNTAQFDACFSSRKYKGVVDAGLAEGERVGIRGTPTVFVGPYQVSNPYDTAAYERLLGLLR